MPQHKPFDLHAVRLSGYSKAQENKALDRMLEDIADSGIKRRCPTCGAEINHHEVEDYERFDEDFEGGTR